MVPGQAQEVEGSAVSHPPSPHTHPCSSFLSTEIPRQCPGPTGWNEGRWGGGVGWGGGSKT